MPVIPAFYYWQTNLNLSNEQLTYLGKLRCKKLYVKIADIGLEEGSGEVVPYTQLSIGDSVRLEKFEVARVVFITNEVFRKIKPEKISWLADKLSELNDRYHFPNDSAGSYEFQVDCDWTESTRESFFHFLNELKGRLPQQASLSATIRLHQYKFPDRTGVPPVDRGMLMCYNTGDIDSPGESNSILDLEDAKKYLQGKHRAYPLPLDVALPVFSWTLVYRDEELWKIIPGSVNDASEGELTAGTYQSGHYLRPGDFLRRETISADLLKDAVRLAASATLADDATLAFFALDKTTLSAYPVQLIDDVCLIADSIRVKQ